MSKIEWALLGVLFIASCLFSFSKPDESIEERNKEVLVVVSVEGLKNEQLTFNHNPTIEEIFERLDVDNTYGFQDDYVLASQEVLYIPENTKLISLNHASIEELVTLKGIGEKTAQKIIEYRNETPFQTIEDIQNIKGIGEKTYQKLRGFLCL